MQQIDEKMKKAKLAAVRKAMKNLEKITKKENLVQIYGESSPIKYECIPTGFLTLDAACTQYGVPRGRAIELFGAESSGKSLICQKIMAAAQRQGGLACYVDMECTLDPDFAEKLGVNMDELIVSQPGSLQEAFVVIDQMVDAGVDVVVLDSIAALVPKEELEAEVGKQTVGLVARYMSQFLRRITKKLADKKSILLLVNQVRQAIGVMYGDPTTTPGGKATAFYSSLRLRVSRPANGYIKVKNSSGEEEIIGTTVRVKVVKNKTAPPYRTAEFKVYFDGRKVDDSDEIADIAIARSLIPRYNSKGELTETGRFYKWPDEPDFLAKKKDDVAEQIRKFPNVKETLLKIIKEGSYAEHAYTYGDNEIEDDDFDSIVDEPDEEELAKEISISEAEGDNGLDWGASDD